MNEWETRERKWCKKEKQAKVKKEVKIKNSPLFLQGKSVAGQ